jgi:hypothetical protein
MDYAGEMVRTAKETGSRGVEIDEGANGFWGGELRWNIIDGWGVARLYITREIFERWGGGPGKSGGNEKL